MWPKSVLDEIRAELSVYNVVTRRHKLKKVGAAEYQAVDDPSLTVNTAKNLWYDFGNGKEGGDIFQFQMFATGCTFGQAVEELAQIAGMTPPEKARRGNGKAADGLEPPPVQPDDYGFEPPARRSITATYDYRDADGILLYQSCRQEWEEDGKKIKTFFQRRPHGHVADNRSEQSWIFGLQAGEYLLNNYDGNYYLATEERLKKPFWRHAERIRVPACAPILYRLPELREQMAQTERAFVFIPEGEKDCDTLAQWGLLSTTNSGGTNNWRQDHADQLRGADVVILEDNDEAGRKRGYTVAMSLRFVAARVRLLRWPDHWPACPDKGDVTDWVEAGGTADRLFEIVDKLPEWTPESGSAVQLEAVSGPMPARLIKSSREFVADFKPPDYLIDGILQRGFCYAFTGRTGAGKTAIELLFAAHVALGRPLGNRNVTRGQVLVFSGENPDDVRARWIAKAQQMDFDIGAIGVHFIAGTFKVSEMMGTVRSEMEEIGDDFAMICVDTSAAYFEGDDENSNVQSGKWARLLRSLTQLPGHPTVLIACHPPKNAGDDNLLPRGGGAFLAEVDGNLTAAKAGDSGGVTVHWQGKFRGPDFAPLSFQLRTVTHERLKDSHGQLLPQVVASILSEDAEEAIATSARKNEDELLKVVAQNSAASYAKLANLLGWKMRSGEPYKMMVRRIADELIKANLLTKTRNRLELTPKGQKAVEALGK
jgi:hypothetical protein